MALETNIKSLETVMQRFLMAEAAKNIKQSLQMVLILKQFRKHSEMVFIEETVTNLRTILEQVARTFNNFTFFNFRNDFGQKKIIAERMILQRFCMLLRIFIF
jgi:hypothetical protein